MRKTKLAWAVLFSIFLMNYSYAATSDRNFTIFTSSNFARLNGYLQVPSGGQSGTSSLGEPTFAQLGLTQTSYYQLGFNYDWTQWGMYGEYQHLRPASHQSLDETLISHGITLASGTSLATDTKFDFYRLGLRRYFDLTDALSIYPEIELAGWHFAYQFNAPGISSVRAFHSMTNRLGMGFNYHFTHDFYLSGEALSSIPKLSNLQVQTAKTDINYTILKSQKMDTTIFTGVGYERMHFKDKQTLSNDINMTAAPMVELGIKLSF